MLSPGALTLFSLGRRSETNALVDECESNLWNHIRVSLPDFGL